MQVLSKSFRKKFLAILVFATAWSVYHEHYVGDFKRTINIDGIGYNAYLPALFLHDGNLQWTFFETSLKKQPLFKDRLQDFRKPAGNGRYVNKYPLGLSITQLPLWLAAWGTYGFSREPSGYEWPFETAVFLNNLLWLFIGLWLFSKFLRHLQWKESRILLVILILLFGTNLFHFITFDNSLTHPINLGFSMMAFYFLHQYISTHRHKYFLLFLAVMVLLFCIRPINIFMLPFFIFFYFFCIPAGRISGWKQFVSIGIFMFLAFFLYFGSIKLQTGHWLVYTYQDEKFVFNEWHLGDVLIGYRCGVFLYTPVLLLFLLLWIRNSNRRLVIGFAFSMLLATWVISTWNEFCYGCRLGNRPMVDYFAFFVVPLTWANWNFKKWARFGIVFFLLFCFYYNQILHYQYRHYLLDWCDVKKEQFWQVFLRTHRPSHDQ